MPASNFIICSVGIKNIIIRSGKRYCLIQKMPKEIEEKETTKEPEIFVY